MPQGRTGSRIDGCILMGPIQERAALRAAAGSYRGDGGTKRRRGWNFRIKINQLSPPHYDVKYLSPRYMDGRIQRADPLGKSYSALNSPLRG